MHHPQDVALMMVDLQNGFFEHGPLKERRAELLQHTRALLAWAHRLGLLVVNVRTQHRADRSTWTLNMLEDDQGFALVGEHGAQPLPELDLGGCVEVIKTRDDAFLGTDLATLLRAQRIGTIVLAGVSTHSCIATTAARAYAENFHVVLASDAIASDRPAVHETTLGLLAEEFRFAVLTSTTITQSASSLSRRAAELPSR